MKDPARSAVLDRNPKMFSDHQYDLIIVGGGIYGAMLSLEASRRGLRSLLLEAGDFGGKTSGNHLRIIHGGLRYLQKLDLKRFVDSVRERGWFLRFFPDLVTLLDCLMPLYGRGLKRVPVMRAAMAVNDLLAAYVQKDVPVERRPGPGRVLSSAATRELFPLVNPQGLQGAALWQDGFAVQSPRLMMELLHWSAAFGGDVLNYCQAQELVTIEGRVVGVSGQEMISGESYNFTAPIVVNAAGPWCREVASRWHTDFSTLFPHRVLVWNILFKRPQLASVGVAVSPPVQEGAHTYFLVPWYGRLMAGTGHAVVNDNSTFPPTREHLNGMLDDLNLAVPGLNVQVSDIERVLWGHMPGTSDGTLGDRECFIDHGESGGPQGLHSISGVKFTTARRVAERFLRSIFPAASPKAYGEGFRRPGGGTGRGLLLEPSSKGELDKLIAEEAVCSLEDLVLRRTDLADRGRIGRDDLLAISRLMQDGDDGLLEEKVDLCLAEYKGGLSNSWAPSSPGSVAPPTSEETD